MRESRGRKMVPETGTCMGGQISSLCLIVLKGIKDHLFFFPRNVLFTKHILCRELWAGREERKRGARPPAGAEWGREGESEGGGKLEMGREERRKKDRERKGLTV